MNLFEKLIKYKKHISTEIVDELRVVFVKKKNERNLQNFMKFEIHITKNDKKTNRKIFEKFTERKTVVNIR